ncbi:hypothetical protein JVU11DRAFT_1654 [Chiua virens]|nr:hypothetical protein JVU11DRAFT_1654 [Chiua virens]
MLTLSEAYNKSVQEESTLSAEKLKTRHVGNKTRNGIWRRRWRRRSEIRSCKVWGRCCWQNSRDVCLVVMNPTS